MKIFVSSTYIDLIEYRRAVENAINRLREQHVMMEYFGSRPEEPKIAALNEVKECDIFLGVYAHRYGTVPKGDTKSVTEQEFDLAKTRGIPIFAYRVNQDHPWPPKMIERGAGEEKLAAFMKRVDEFQRSEFTDPADLAFKVATDLGKWLKDSYAPAGPKARFVQKMADPAEIYRCYTNYIIATFDKIDATRIAKDLDRTLEHIPLAKVYVPLRGSVAIPEHDVYKRTARVVGRKLGDIVSAEDIISHLEQERVATLTLHDALAKYPGLVILGDPGSGKTTFLKYVAVTFAQNEQAQRLGLAESRVPIFLSIAAYAESLREEKHQLTLVDYFTRYYHDVHGFDDELIPLLANALDEGRATILLDGLDEVKEEHERGRVAEQVERFWNHHRNKGNRLVITSRIIGYKRLTAPGLTHLTVHDFDDDDIRLFLEKWCPVIESAVEKEQFVIVRNAARERSELENAIFHGALGIRELAANPLLLTLLVLIKRKGVHLPEQRVELYEEYIKALVENWALHRNPDRILTQTRRYNETERILAALALWMRETNPEAGVVDQPAVEDWLINIHTDPNAPPAIARAAAHKFVTDLRNDCGLIVERGHRVYGFLHQTLEEYLAAKGLCYKSDTAIEPILAEMRVHRMPERDIWRETILLAVGHLSVIQRSPGRAAQLVEGLLREELHGDAQGLNIVRAGEALLDVGRSGVTNAVWDATLKALQATMTNVAVPVITRRDAGLLLGNLGWLPDGADALETLMPIPKGKFRYSEENVDQEIKDDFWIGRYPVTNLQFKEFKEAGGYGDPRKSKPPWWSSKGWQLRKKEKWDRPCYWDDRRFNNLLQPVVGVSWFEAEAYCNWLKEETGIDYRLPAEEEWEKAARGEKGNIYPGKVFDIKYANTGESELGATTPVMMYPEGEGVYNVLDMCGNVWEWTDSWYGDETKVLRGSSWGGDQGNARCALRGRSSPSFRFSAVGFRCSMTSK